MPRTPKYLYQIEDYTDSLWNVYSERQTAHGWPLLFGRCTDIADGEKAYHGSGTAVIITKELAAYMEAMRMTPGLITLPIKRYTTVGGRIYYERARMEAYIAAGRVRPVDGPGRM